MKVNVHKCGLQEAGISTNATLLPGWAVARAISLDMIAGLLDRGDDPHAAKVCRSEKVIDQLQAFETYNISPRSFERTLAQVDSSLVVDGYIILEPEQPAEPVKKRWFHKHQSE